MSICVQCLKIIFHKIIHILALSVAEKFLLFKDLRKIFLVAQVLIVDQHLMSSVKVQRFTTKHKKTLEKSGFPSKLCDFRSPAPLFQGFHHSQKSIADV